MRLAVAALLLSSAPALAGSALDVPPLNIDLSLSPRAAATLSQSGEMIHVSAVYYGRAAKPEDGDEMGQVLLGTEDIDIPGAQRVTFGTVSLDGAALAKATDQQAYVNINVYTSRRKFADNLLSCGLFEDRLEVAAQAAIAIACKLIDEP